MSQFVGGGSNFSLTDYYTPGMAAKYSDQRMLFVHVSHTHIPQTTRLNLTKFSVLLLEVMAHSSSDNIQ